MMVRTDKIVCAKHVVLKISCFMYIWCFAMRRIYSYMTCIHETHVYMEYMRFIYSYIQYMNRMLRVGLEG